MSSYAMIRVIEQSFIGVQIEIIQGLAAPVPPVDVIDLDAPGVPVDVIDLDALGVPVDVIDLDDPVVPVAPGVPVDVIDLDDPVVPVAPVAMNMIDALRVYQAERDLQAERDERDLQAERERRYIAIQPQVDRACAQLREESRRRTEAEGESRNKAPRQNYQQDVAAARQNLVQNDVAYDNQPDIPVQTEEVNQPAQPVRPPPRRFRRFLTRIEDGIDAALNTSLMEVVQAAVAIFFSITNAPMGSFLDRL